MTNEEFKQIQEYIDSLAMSKRGGIPTCPCCGTRMIFRHGNIHENPLAVGANYKCPKCFLILPFGLPLTREEYETIYKLFGNSRHCDGKPSEDLAEGKLHERLKALGYIEMR